MGQISEWSSYITLKKVLRDWLQMFICRHSQPFPSRLLPQLRKVACLNEVVSYKLQVPQTQMRVDRARLV